MLSRIHKAKELLREAWEDQVTAQHPKPTAGRPPSPSWKERQEPSVPIPSDDPYHPIESTEPPLWDRLKIELTRNRIRFRTPAWELMDLRFIIWVSGVVATGPSRLSNLGGHGLLAQKIFRMNLSAWYKPWYKTFQNRSNQAKIGGQSGQGILFKIKGFQDISKIFEIRLEGLIIPRSGVRVAAPPPTRPSRSRCGMDVAKDMNSALRAGQKWQVSRDDDASETVKLILFFDA